MGLHHATLKAAVAVYAILLAQGKSEADIKDAISKDEKGFKPDEIEEIYAAIVAQNDAEQSENGSKADTEDKAAESPDFSEVIASNRAVIESNERLEKAIGSFIKSANILGERIAGHPEVKSTIKADEIDADFDPKADYVVAEGKSFRHSNDFNKAFKEGDKVEGFAEDKLRSLYRQGLIVEAE